MQIKPRLVLAETQELKRAIQQVRYEISVAAEAPDSLERLPALYSHLASLYSQQEMTRKADHSDSASSH